MALRTPQTAGQVGGIPSVPTPQFTISTKDLQDLLTPSRISDIGINVSIANATDFFLNDIVVPSNGKFQCFAAFGTAAKLQIRYDTTNVTGTLVAFNNDTNLTADAPYAFEWPVLKDQRINFRHNSGGAITVRYFYIIHVKAVS